MKGIDSSMKGERESALKSPPAKKLRQALLPFQTLGARNSEPVKKRKLEDADEDIVVIKYPRTSESSEKCDQLLDLKENLGASVITEPVKESDSDSKKVLRDSQTVSEASQSQKVIPDVIVIDSEESNDQEVFRKVNKSVLPMVSGKKGKKGGLDTAKRGKKSGEASSSKDSVEGNDKGDEAVQKLGQEQEKPADVPLYNDCKAEAGCDSQETKSKDESSTSKRVSLDKSKLAEAGGDSHQTKDEPSTDKRVLLDKSKPEAGGDSQQTKGKDEPSTSKKVSLDKSKPEAGGDSQQTKSKDEPSTSKRVSLDKSKPEAGGDSQQTKSKDEPSTSKRVSLDKSKPEAGGDSQQTKSKNEPSTSKRVSLDKSKPEAGGDSQQTKSKNEPSTSKSVLLDKSKLAEAGGDSQQIKNKDEPSTSKKISLNKSTPEAGGYSQQTKSKDEPSTSKSVSLDKSKLAEIDCEEKTIDSSMQETNCSQTQVTRESENQSKDAQNLQPKVKEGNIRSKITPMKKPTKVDSADIRERMKSKLAVFKPGNKHSETSENQVDADEAESTAEASKSPDKSNVEDTTSTPKQNNKGASSGCVSPAISDVSSLSDDSNSPALHTSSTSSTPVQNTTPKSSTASPKPKKLTPKQLQRFLEQCKKKQQKENERQEREKMRAKEKAERERQRKEKEEQKKKEKEEREKMKEEKLKKKQAELDMKLKEKELKEEERRKKDEEKKKKEEGKKKKEEERLKKEEEKKKVEEDEKKKKEKVAAQFASFFLQKKIDARPDEAANTDQTFMPFEVKADMRLAPTCRVHFNPEKKEAFDKSVGSQEVPELYLQELKSNEVQPKRTERTWPLSDLKDDVMIIEDEDDEDLPSTQDSVVVDRIQTKIPRPKLLQFHENRRPPYWGTWQKKSAIVKSTQPFGKDEKFFDYEVDSDEEWEEEEPGESLHGSDDEKESEDEYEVDNDFFVPHGYLSDEEAMEEEDEVLSPDMHKAKLKLLEIEFENERKKKTEHIKPTLLGCFWLDENNNSPVYHQMMKILNPYKAVTCMSSIPTSFNAPKPGGDGSPSSGTPADTPGGSSSGTKLSKFPDEAIPTLLKLTHGNVNGREFLVKEFLAYWKKQHSTEEDKNPVSSAESGPLAEEPVVNRKPKWSISKLSVSRKIREVARWMQCPEEGPLQKKMWYVSRELRDAHGLPDLTLPNQWNYILKPKRESDITPLSTPVEQSPKPAKTSIKKFTKHLSAEERRQQLESASSSSPLTTPPSAKKISIKHFTKHLSQEERRQQLETAAVPSTSTVPTPKVESKKTDTSKIQRKRISPLISVPRGQDIPKGARISSFFDKSQRKEQTGSTESVEKCIKTNPDACKSSDDCITLD